MQIAFGWKLHESTVLFYLAMYMWTVQTKLLTNQITLKEHLIFIAATESPSKNAKVA